MFDRITKPRYELTILDSLIAFIELFVIGSIIIEIVFLVIFLYNKWRKS